jgi:diguanylate cyclase
MKTPTLDTTVLKSIVVMTILAVLLGLTGILSPLDKALSVGVSKIRTQSVSNEIVVIGIDDKSLDEIGSWPWDRKIQGDLLTKLDSYQPKRIVTDIYYSTPTNDSSDQALANSIQNLKSEFYLAKNLPKNIAGRSVEDRNLPLIAKGQNEASIVSYADLGLIWEIPTKVTDESGTIPSLSVAIAGLKNTPLKIYRPDYSYDPSTIKIISASDVLKNRIDLEILKSKVLVYAPISARLHDMYRMPAWGKQPGIFFQIFGAETIKAGITSSFDPAPITITLGIICLIIAFAFRKNWRVQTIISVICLIVVSAMLQLEGYYIEIFPSLTLICGVSVLLSRNDKALIASKTNMLTGLSTLDGLRSEQAIVQKPLAVGHIANFSSIYSSLDEADKKLLINAVIARIELVAHTNKIFHDLQGGFAWYMTNRAGEHISDQLQALVAVFRSPITIGESVVKLSIYVGVDIDGDQQTPRRLTIAMALANKAMATGVHWLLNEAQAETNRVIQLSKDIYSAIQNDEITIALQPQIDFRTNSCVGAEALVRWHHPTLGKITADQIVTIASDQGLIEELTCWIAKQAMIDAEKINAIRRGFNISINIPPSLLTGNSLADLIMPILASTKFPPALLTLEITEQTEILAFPKAIEQIRNLRRHNIKISIDDYGTGYANLAKLSNVPFDEIKLDRSFVATIKDSEANYAIVETTIMLAKRLGKKVVAEGIESQAIADELRKMGCDQAQGYLYGKPMNINAFLGYIAQENGKNSFAI